MTGRESSSRRPPEARKGSDEPAGDQRRQRRGNLEKLCALGVQPYPHRFDGSDTVSTLVGAHGDRTGEALEEARPEAAVAGRIVAIRSFGKANFLVLSDGKARLQVYVRKDSVSARDFDLFKLLDVGDFVGTAGRVFRTRTDELTIRAGRLEFLAKCFVPLPEKWHGLTDVETRYRQRYLDLIVNPDARRVFETRARTLAAIRRFLDARGYLEVETPMMQPLAGGALARAVRHASQRARPAALPAHRAGAVPQAAGRRRHGAGLRDQPQLPQRGDLDPAQPRVHDAGVLRGVQRLSRADDAHRGAARRGRGRGAGGGEVHVRRRGRSPGARPSPGGRCGPPSARRSPSGWAREVAEADLREREAAAALARELGVEVTPGAGAGRITFETVRGAVREGARAADLRLRFSDRGVAVVEAAGRRPGDGGAVRAVRRGHGDRQCVQRAERSAGAAPALRGAARGARPAATTRRTPSTRTISGRSSTACRPRPARGSGSTGWSCC